MIFYQSIPAEYKPTGVRKYDGNPYIEALPRLEETKDEILDRIAYYPPAFTEADRRKGDLVRIAELARIGSLIHPFAEFRRAATAATFSIRDAYLCRNPFTVKGRRRRTMIATLNDVNAFDALAFKSSAQGQLIMAVTGSGKTTLGGGIFAPYCQVIEHAEYQGHPFRCRQIPVIPMAVMHDASLLSFCVQFFETIDRILGNTQYAKEAKAVRTIALMALLIHKVANAVSLGLVFIDDVHHLRAAKGKQADMVLNLLSQILEIAGVSLMLSATPALEPVIAQSVRNIRKLASGGTSKFPVMHRTDPQWIALATALWRYLIVRRPGPLTKDILDAWHSCSGGNPAFTTMSFTLAQRQEIGDREMVDELSFQRVAETEMILLKPAIKALLSGKAEDLQKFDDLVPKSGLMELQDQLGWAREAPENAEDEPEFSELEEAEEPAVARNSKASASMSKPKAKSRTKGKAIAKPGAKAKPSSKSQRSPPSSAGLPTVQPLF